MNPLEAPFIDFAAKGDATGKLLKQGTGAPRVVLWLNKLLPSAAEDDPRAVDVVLSSVDGVTKEETDYIAAWAEVADGAQRMALRELVLNALAVLPPDAYRSALAAAPGTRRANWVPAQMDFFRPLALKKADVQMQGADGEKKRFAPRYLVLLFRFLFVAKTREDGEQFVSQYDLANVKSVCVPYQVFPFEVLLLTLSLSLSLSLHPLVPPSTPHRYSKSSKEGRFVVELKSKDKLVFTTGSEPEMTDWIRKIKGTVALYEKSLAEAKAALALSKSAQKRITQDGLKAHFDGASVYGSQVVSRMALREQQAAQAAAQLVAQQEAASAQQQEAARQQAEHENLANLQKSIFAFANAGDAAGLQSLVVSNVGRKIEFNIAMQGGFTPLHLAAGSGNAQAVALLVGQGAAVASITTTGFTPLHVAVSRGHSAVCKLLVEAGAPIDLPDADGRAPTDVAVLVNQPEIGAYLQQVQNQRMGVVEQAPAAAAPAAAADSDSEDGFYDPLDTPKVPLLKAADAFALAASGDWESLATFVEKGGNIFAAHMISNGDGDTILHIFSRAGDEEALQWAAGLKGAPLDEDNRAGDMPIHVAARANSFACVDILVTAGADAALEDKTGESAAAIMAAAAAAAEAEEAAAEAAAAAAAEAEAVAAAEAAEAPQSEERDESESEAEAEASSSGASEAESEVEDDSDDVAAEDGQWVPREGTEEFAAYEEARNGLSVGARDIIVGVVEPAMGKYLDEADAVSELGEQLGPAAMDELIDFAMDHLDADAVAESHELVSRQEVQGRKKKKGKAKRKAKPVAVLVGTPKSAGGRRPLDSMTSVASGMGYFSDEGPRKMDAAAFALMTAAEQKEYSSKVKAVSVKAALRLKEREALALESALESISSDMEEKRAAIKQSSDDADLRMCVVCMDKAVNIVVAPCMHAALCSDCVVEMGEDGVQMCVMCRGDVSRTIQVKRIWRP